MKKKNELDILFNGNDEIVKDLAQRPVLNERERKKMLEMSKKKLEGMKNNASYANTEYTSGESVQGVENYKRSIMIKRVLSAAACMVLIGGVAGTMFLMNKHNGNKGVKGDSSVITPAVATTVETDDKASQTTIVSTSVNETTVTSVQPTSPAVSNEIQTTAVEYSTPSVYEQEAVNNAALNYMAEFTGKYETMATNIEYILVDLNNDSVPELLITSENMVTNDLNICTYDGHQYNIVNPDGNSILFYNLKISPENGMICTSGKNLSTLFIKINSDNTLEIIDKMSNWWDGESDSMGFWRNDQKITETEYNDIISKYDAYNWIEPEYTFYADHNGYIVDNAPQLYTDIDIDKLIEYGELPAGERELAVCYGLFDYKIDPANVDLNDEDMGGSAGGEYYPSDGKITDQYPYSFGRKYRIRVEILDRGNDQRHNLLVADIDFATGECNILQNKYPDAVNMHF